MFSLVGLLCITSFILFESIRKNTKELVKSATDNVQAALCSAAQGADHLLYPALCFFVGKSAYDRGVSAILPSAPEGLEKLEDYVPGANSARHGLTCVVIGGAVCVGLNYLSSIAQVNAFFKTNMPHLSALLHNIKIDLSPEDDIRKNN